MQQELGRYQLTIVGNRVLEDDGTTVKDVMEKALHIRDELGLKHCRVLNYLYNTGLFNIKYRVLVFLKENPDNITEYNYE